MGVCVCSAAYRALTELSFCSCCYGTLLYQRRRWKKKSLQYKWRREFESAIIEGKFVTYFYFSIFFFVRFTLTILSVVRFFFTIFQELTNVDMVFFYIIFLFLCIFCSPANGWGIWSDQMQTMKFNLVLRILWYFSIARFTRTHKNRAVSASRQYLLSINFAVRWSWFRKNGIAFEKFPKCFAMDISTLSVHCMPYSVWVPPTKRAWALWIAFWLTLNTANTHTPIIRACVSVQVQYIAFALDGLVFVRETETLWKCFLAAFATNGFTCMATARLWLAIRARRRNG